MSTTEEKLRNSVSQRLYTMEAVFYITVGILLAAAAVVAVFDAGMMLWRLVVVFWEIMITFATVSSAASAASKSVVDCPLQPLHDF